MTVVKVIEIICDGPTIEKALQAGVAEAHKTLKHLVQVEVVWVHGHIEKGKIAFYRVKAKISFVIEHEK